MGKFKTGDKVVVTAHNDNISSPIVFSKDVFNLVGIICGVHSTTWSDGSTSYLIRFEKYIDGHDCNGLCEYGYGQNINEKYLKLYDEKKSEDKTMQKEKYEKKPLE